MKHRNNYTYKIQYLDEIRHSGRTPSSEELVKMYRMSQDKSSTIRCALTQALVNRYTPESEKVLRIMADDKNGLVRVNAIDSLGIGREEESVEFLMERMNRKYSKMESGYAALSYFDVYINRYGYNEKSVREYLENVRELYSQEDRSWVIVCYETNRYLAGEADALDQLFTFFKEENGKDSSVQRAAATSIRDRVNIFNKDEIKRRLEEIGSERAKREVKQIEDEKIMPKILILSEENVGMSHFWSTWESVKRSGL